MGVCRPPTASAGRARAPRVARARARRSGFVLLGELGLCLGELAELLLPAGLEAAGDQAVLGLAGVERALGADRLIAGALDAQLDRAGRARASVGDLVGGRERQLDLLRRERLEQPARDQLVDHGRLDRPAAGRVDVVGARVAAFVVAALAAVKRGHRPAAGAAAHDPLAQRAALPRRALPRVRVVGGQPPLVGQDTAPS